MTIALLASMAGAGCLVTDPVEEVEDGGNTNPQIFQISPDNGTTVFIANSNTPVTFTARANDAETDDEQLYYEWSVDNGPIVLEGPDLKQYSTSGAALGAGLHVIDVFVTDDGVPTGFTTAQWQVQVQ